MPVKSVDGVLTAILLALLLMALAATVYITITPKKGEEFTEFYILGTGGKAAGYPTELSAGEQGEVIVGVVNHEYETSSYVFRAEIENGTIGEKELQLAHNETLEFPFVFTAREKGRKKLVFNLSKEGAAAPYRELYLWIDVR